MPNHVEVIVIGAGVVGLAVARALCRQGREVVVLEQHRFAGQETSSRNSGVIHSGIYYPTGSLKARLCVAGRTQLYAYCEQRNVGHRRCGKLIVAQQAQLPALESLRRLAVANGVHDLRSLTAAQIRKLEPEVRGAAGLWCPSTGIIDVHEYMTCLSADIESHGGSVVFASRFLSARAGPSVITVLVESSGDADEVSCDWLVNSAGLSAVPLLARIDGYHTASPRKPYYAKGNYFVCQGQRPFTHLVYPMPDKAGLGVHATLDLDGATRFGPDVEWVDAADYSVDPARAADFYRAIREYWPSLEDGALRPGYAGIRPKLVGSGESAADFAIETPLQHGVPGLINLLGIESPGLTASLAIGDHVARHLTGGASVGSSLPM